MGKKEDGIMRPRNLILTVAIVTCFTSVALAQAPDTTATPPPAEATPPPTEATPPPAEATPPPAAAAQATTPPADTSTPEGRIEAVKQSLASSAAGLKQYEWNQKVTVSLKGEEKARKDFKCSYGPDGKVKKVPAAAAAEEQKKKRGLRGKAAENKKEDIEAALKASMALLDQYSPLEAARLQTAKNAGNVSVSVPGADNRVKVTIKDYLKPGDIVEVEVDGAKSTLQSVAITSAIDQKDAKGPVQAKVTYAAMTDGTLYPREQVLDLKAQSIMINVENSGYAKKAGQAASK
jgi:hypothetical protein